MGTILFYLGLGLIIVSLINLINFNWTTKKLIICAILIVVGGIGVFTGNKIIDNKKIVYQIERRENQWL